MTSRAAHQAGPAGDQDAIPKVAIACQGGGSHTAFTAGALEAILSNAGQGRDWRLVGLSGSSGGAICALLAWYGLLRHASQPNVAGVRAAAGIGAFWADNAATEWWDWLTNQYLVGLRRLQDAGLLGHFAPPPVLRRLAQDSVRALIERHVDFEALHGLLAQTPDHPTLAFSAVDAVSGSFAVFEECCPDPTWQRLSAGDLPPSVSVAAVLASSAVPPAFPGVDLGPGRASRYWDGLYAYNPPIRALLDRPPAERPDEVWVIQIDPTAVPAEPQSLPLILDRQAQLSANLSLNGEIHWIKQVNRWVRDGLLPDSEFKQIRVARIEMSEAVGAGRSLASKADRSPDHLNTLIADGRTQAAAFLRRRADGDDACWEPTFPHVRDTVGR
jgi:NTE family protein